uniref:Uncharacterized protein n=1 Tax=Branchiostoma floridae TaxID=7739 RepID=C3YSU9_BRAFL|eukprot:XP_002600601.1 hypothetical protein BRAFLDRAFT_101622 [Branchiostoma floridae]
MTPDDVRGQTHPVGIAVPGQLAFLRASGRSNLAGPFCWIWQYEYVSWPFLLDLAVCQLVLSAGSGSMSVGPFCWIWQYVSRPFLLGLAVCQLALSAGSGSMSVGPFCWIWHWPFLWGLAEFQLAPLRAQSNFGWPYPGARACQTLAGKFLLGLAVFQMVLPMST